MSDVSPTSSPRSERRARLRRRLVGGLFTALLLVEWGTAQAAHASVTAPTGAPPASIQARADGVRAALPLTADENAPARADQPAMPWGNGWLNWANGWNNWHNVWNNWNNWANAWNNWSNAWNNWHNWSNAWHNI